MFISPIKKPAGILPGILLLLLLFSGLWTPVQGQSDTPFLSNMRATADDPLYSTYAAPMQRSEYVVDQGYHLNYYSDENGIELETEHSGDWGMVVKKEGDIRYLRSQMVAKPVVTSSYSDFATYSFKPYEGVKVTVFFDVYSSKYAIQDITVHNLLDKEISIELYPYLHHNEGLDSISTYPSQSYLSFNHYQPVDGWTRSHDIPYVTDYRNVFMSDDSAAGFGAYSSMGTPPSESSSSFKQRSFSTAQLPESNYAVEYGRVYHSDGTMCTHEPPQAQQIIQLNGSDQKILTEKAPKWGDTDPNIPGNGWQGAELGNLQPPDLSAGDEFTVFFNCHNTGESGTGNGGITELPDPDGIRTDITLNHKDTLDRPTNLSVEFSQNGQSAALDWQPAHPNIYKIYRRSHQVMGKYRKVGEVDGQSSYLDTNLNSDSSYSYLVVSYDEQGQVMGHSNEAGAGTQRSFLEAVSQGNLEMPKEPVRANVVALQRSLTLQPDGKETIRLVRGIDSRTTETTQMASTGRELMDFDLQQVRQRAEQTYRNIPELALDNQKKEMLYWSAFNLIRQLTMPPEGLASYNYYLFSREPTWGWGHGGQVFHESLVMLAYVFMDAQSARESQRVYMERQKDNGYIDYRSGPYLEEQIPTNGKLTTSAPWYNWENWQLYKHKPDSGFLNDAYRSGQQFYRYWEDNRDQDNDGLYEWGAHAVLESVRDGQVAVWDQVGWPSEFESLGLNSMLVKEARSLAKMAKQKGDTSAYNNWSSKAENLARRINETFWDEETDFYYHVDRSDHDFTYEENNDLKRKEIIGFLPLWAEVADEERAQKLVDQLTDTRLFWRDYGVPSLSAGDPYYNDKGYWNGPVWVQWNYLIYRGLRNYGYTEKANVLADKVYQAVIEGLQRDHTFWEFYSPDESWGGYHQAYIWTGIVARMMLEQAGKTVDIDDQLQAYLPEKYILKQNYPNPFNNSTVIQYELPNDSPVTLSIYNMTGQKVATLVDENQAAGNHEVHFNAKDLASGVYFYQLTTPGRNQTRKMILLK